MIINIRGTNGSGKTTLARAFIGDPAETEVVLHEYEEQLKASVKTRAVLGYRHDGVIVVGSYRTACGGLDTVKTFELSRRVIRTAADLGGHVVAEGVLASTVFGSWAAFARQMDEAGYPFAFCYLQTPVEVCLERIRQRIRDRGEEVRFDEKLVRDKVRAVAATRERAMAAGLQVFDLPIGDEERALREIMGGEGDAYVAE